MLTLTLRAGESVSIGGIHGQTMRLGDEEVIVVFKGIVRDDSRGGRIQLSIDAPGKAIQRTNNLGEPAEPDAYGGAMTPGVP